MKKHAIIPIFIPHIGCPHDCIFCNQRSITARMSQASLADVRKTIDTWLTTLKDVDTVEVAFYGGSFTGIPLEQQNAYLEVAQEYKDNDLIDKVHLSTRPDYIDGEILQNLKKHSVDTIELGVQSFDDRVLRLAERGHDSATAERAAKAIKDYGFELGIQLMIGLPGDNRESAIRSAELSASLSPELARLYPTVVLKDTELARQYAEGKYVPPTQEEMIETTKEMYRILAVSGVTIMRVGLKSTDIIAPGAESLEGAYHPAFRQLVEGRIAREKMEIAIAELIGSGGSPAAQGAEELNNRKTGKGRADKKEIRVYTSPSWVSNVAGHRGENKAYFKNKYSGVTLKIIGDEEIPEGEIRIKEG